MNIIGLDNKEYNLIFKRSKRNKKNESKYHKRARSVLTNEFPCFIIYEEVALPGTKNERQRRPLFADFFIPEKRIIVEVQGEQHYKYNEFFYKKDKLAFFTAQSRDRNKQRWCSINNITLIELPFCDTDEEWVYKIRNT